MDAGGRRDHRRCARARRRGAAATTPRGSIGSTLDAGAAAHHGGRDRGGGGRHSRPSLPRRSTSPRARIEAFHRAQLPADLRTDGRGRADARACAGRALDAVGLYVPGGKAAYPSSVLMNALPARVAGRRAHRDVRAEPGRRAQSAGARGRAARRGLGDLPGRRRAGGRGARLRHRDDRARWTASSVRATPTWRRPSGRCSAGSGIDSIAGPSEVVVLADAANDPRHVAVDLLAQAEHDEAAQAILITDRRARSPTRSPRRSRRSSPTLPRAAIAGASWAAHGAVILVRDWEEAAGLVNRLAPEHLQIMVREPEALFARIRHAGAAFLGAFCPEAVGDYVAGPNHVLPTGRTARFASGLSVFDFLKRTTWVAADAAALAPRRPGRGGAGRGGGIARPRAQHRASARAKLDPAQARSIMFRPEIKHLNED